jgi:5,5'-dehydrodivanillate O-demethylase
MTQVVSRPTTGAPRKVLSPYEDFTSTGPDTLNGRYLRQFWLPVYRSDKLASGAAKPLRALSEDFTLYRGEDGVPHIVAQRCPHRGTQLSVGFVEGGEIRCLYHGWKFNGAGQCTEMPAEAAEFPAKVCIRSVPAREHVGLIFGYFGEGEPPPFPHLPGFIGDGILEHTENLTGYNYFQGWENDFDAYHAVWTHRVGAVHYQPLMEERYEEKPFGIVRYSKWADGTPRAVTYALPTTVHLFGPAATYYRDRGIGPKMRETFIMHLPVDDTHQIVFQAQNILVPPEEHERYLEAQAAFRAQWEAHPSAPITADLLAGRRTVVEMRGSKEAPYMAWVEDGAAQGGQGPIADRTSEWLGKSDQGIIYLRKLWARELRALAETGKTTPWTVDQHEVSFYGL